MQATNDTNQKLVVTAFWEVNPGEEATVAELLKEFLPQAQREPGVKEFQIHQNIAKPRKYFFYEVFAGEAAFAEHQQTDALQEHHRRPGDSKTRQARAVAVPLHLKSGGTARRRWPPRRRAASANPVRACCRRGSPRLRTRRAPPSKRPSLLQQVAANARQQVIGSSAPARRARRSTIASAAAGPFGHADRDRAVELDDRRAHQRRQLGIEPGDARPVGRIGRAQRWRDRRRSPPAARRSRPRRRVRAPAPAPASRGGSGAGPTARGSGPSAGSARRLHRCAPRCARRSAPSAPAGHGLRVPAARWRSARGPCAALRCRAAAAASRRRAPRYSLR